MTPQRAGALGRARQARPRPTYAGLRRSYTRFSIRQVNELRRHYTERPAAHFAEQWGVSVRQVYHLAYRHGIRRRAPNGAPVWRQAA